MLKYLSSKLIIYPKASGLSSIKDEATKGVITDIVKSDFFSQMDKIEKGVIFAAWGIIAFLAIRIARKIVHTISVIQKSQNEREIAHNKIKLKQYAIGMVLIGAGGVIVAALQAVLRVGT